ncbi:MAG: hypothetical protein CVT62_11770 [Actinobacteria bacterium HGW-Actinobacteria-2]|nr:MAG: hypothetical protein CVT62_11770 [Actinobacteria bacterium HGW-Actinobacteria-2]
MEIEFNQKAIDALGAEIAHATEIAFNRGLELAAGQPLDQAVDTVVRELAKAGVEPNAQGIRDELAKLGWK